MPFKSVELQVLLAAVRLCPALKITSCDEVFPNRPRTPPVTVTWHVGVPVRLIVQFRPVSCSGVTPFTSVFAVTARTPVALHRR